MFKKVLKFSEFLAESAANASNIFNKGLEFTKKIKETDSKKAEYKHMPCYEYVFKFIQQFKPNLSPDIINVFKMAYKKDIQSLPAAESLKLAKETLQVPSKPDTMRGLDYANSKYSLGRIVSVDQAKVGDAISFWVYQLIEFSRFQENYSYPDTEAKFHEFVKKNKIKTDNLPEWLIEGARIEYGHYGIISEIDNDFFYLSSSGEKNGCNGIWNGVSKDQCSFNFTKIPKADLKKFQNMSYDNLLFKSTDELTNKKVQVIMRSYILNFIQ